MSDVVFQGYSTKDSIALGLSKTGHIITAAGIVMAIAFGGKKQLKKTSQKITHRNFVLTPTF